MKFLFILCGLPFSGKSTISRYLEENYNFKYVGFDDVCKQIEMAEGKFAMPEETLEAAFGRIGEYLENYSVIWDALNDTKAKRDVLRDFALVHKAKPITFYLDIPLEIIQNRRKQSTINQDRPLIKDENFERKVKEFEIPYGEEDTYFVKEDEDLPAILKLLLN